MYGPLDRLKKIDSCIKEVTITTKPRDYNGWIIGLSFIDDSLCEIAIEYTPQYDMMKLAEAAIVEHLKHRKSKNGDQSTPEPYRVRMERCAWLKHDYPSLYEWSMNDATVNAHLDSYVTGSKSLTEVLVALVCQLAGEKQSNLNMAVQAINLRPPQPEYYGPDLIVPVTVEEALDAAKKAAGIK